MTDTSKRLSRAEAAVYIGVSKKTLDKWAWAGEPFIPYYRIGVGGPRGGRAIYDTDDLDKYLASCRVEDPSKTASP